MSNNQSLLDPAVSPVMTMDNRLLTINFEMESLQVKLRMDILVFSIFIIVAVIVVASIVHLMWGSIDLKPVRKFVLVQACLTTVPRETIDHVKPVSLINKEIEQGHFKNLRDRLSITACEKCDRSMVVVSLKIDYDCSQNSNFYRTFPVRQFINLLTERIRGARREYAIDFNIVCIEPMVDHFILVMSMSAMGCRRLETLSRTEKPEHIGSYPIRPGSVREVDCVCVEGPHSDVDFFISELHKGIGDWEGFVGILDGMRGVTDCPDHLGHQRTCPNGIGELQQPGGVLQTFGHWNAYENKNRMAVQNAVGHFSFDFLEFGND